jgi:hypothetical protein
MLFYYFEMSETIKLVEEIKKVEEIEKKAVRISAKKLLLTYSQCPMDINSCFTALKKLLKEHNRKIKDYALSTEKHQDGFKHIHVYIELDKRLDTRNMRFFDIVWNDKTYHPNILKSKYKTACVEYILKDVTELTSSAFIISKALRKTLTIQDDKITVLPYHEALIALARDGCIEDAMQLVEETEPARFAISHRSIRKSLADLATLNPTKDDFIDCTHIPTVMSVRTQLEKAHKEYITPMIVGKTKTGKTRLVLDFIMNTLKLRPLVINNIDSIRHFDSSKHNAVFFDDCDFSGFKNEEMLLKLFDCESATTFSVKHTSVQIPACTARFICSNFLLSYYVGEKIASQERIARRLQIIDIGGESLYQLLPPSTLEPVTALSNNLQVSNEELQAVRDNFVLAELNNDSQTSSDFIFE